MEGVSGALSPWSSRHVLRQGFLLLAPSCSFTKPCPVPCLPVVNCSVGHSTMSRSAGGCAVPSCGAECGGSHLPPIPHSKPSRAVGGCTIPWSSKAISSLTFLPLRSCQRVQKVFPTRLYLVTKTANVNCFVCGVPSCCVLGPLRPSVPVEL